MASSICVDASLVLALLLPEELTTRVEVLWQEWLDARVEVVGPPLLFAEVTSVLRAAVFFGRIAPEDGEGYFTEFLSMGIRQVEPPDLQQRAWALARAHNRPRAYDAQYLAVAEALGSALWTADRRLTRAVGHPAVRWVGDDSETSGRPAAPV